LIDALKTAGNGEVVLEIERGGRIISVNVTLE